MSYHLENSFGQDKFGVHSHISKTLSEIILDENLDLSEGSFTIGLFGKWGSGKSMILDQLKRKHLSSESGVVYVYLDVWKYVNTSLYRSILFDLEKELKNSDNWDVCEKFKNDGYKFEDDSLKDILDRDIQVKHEDPVSLSFIDRFKFLIKKYPIFLFSLLVIFGLKISSDILNWKGFKDVLGYIFQFLIVIGGLKVFEDVFKDIGKNFVSKSSIRVVSSPPTFSQDQFENIFKDMINMSLNSINSSVTLKRMVIVFDNLDRCEPQLSYQTLTGLRTFMESNNCIYIIPCDDKEILNHLNQNTKGIPIDFMDKIFQTYLRIPVLEQFDRDDFIDDLLKGGIVEINEKNFGTVKSILYRGYKGQTPRQINRFINDYETYYRLVENIDPKKEVLLKNLNLFTFFIVIKQVYPEVESLFITFPDFFSSDKEDHPLYKELYNKCIEEGKSEDHSKRTRDNFKSYINTFEKRLNLKEVKDHLNFVFLKTDVRFDYIRLKQDLLDLNEDLVISPESPVLVRRIFDGFIGKNENVFLEDSMSLLGKIISNNPDDIVLNNMFKTLWDYRDIVPQEIFYGNTELIYSKLNTLKTLGNQYSRKKDYVKIINSLFKLEDYREENQNLFDEVLVELEPSEFKKSLKTQVTVEDEIQEDELGLEEILGESFDSKLKPLEYLINTSVEHIIDYIPINYINGLINDYQLDESIDTDSNEKIISVLKLFVDDYGLCNSDISVFLSKEIEKKLVEQQSISKRNNQDDSIILFLSLLNPEFDYDTTLYNSLVKRSTFLVGHNIPDPGYPYFMESLRLVKTPENVDKLLQWFKKSVIFKHETHFLKFLDFLDSEGLELLISIDMFRDVLIERVNDYGYWEEFYKLLNSEILKEKVDLIYDDKVPNSVISLTRRIIKINNKDLNPIKNELIDILKKYEIDDLDLIKDIEYVLESPEDKVEFLINTTSSLFQNVHEQKDLICECIEKLKSYRSDLNRSKKSKLTRQFGKWKKSISNTKHVSKVRRRLE